MKKLLIIVMLNVFILISLVLNSLELTEKRILSETENKIIKVFEDQETDQVVRVYSSFDENNTFHQGLLFENGDRLPFEVGEKVIEILDNKILVKKQLNRADEEVSIYEYNQEKINKTRSMKIGLYNPFHMLKNGNFFYSDYAEGFAWTFSLYSSNLDLIRTYKPFDSGFEIYYYEDFGDCVFVGIAQTITENKSTIFYLIDSTSGNIINETIIDTRIDRISRIKKIRNKVIIFSYSKIIAVDFLGNILWEKENPGTISYLSEVSIEYNHLFAYAKGQIICIELTNGNLLWENILKNYNYKTDSNIIPTNTSIFVSSENRMISLIIGDYKQRTWEKILLINLDFEGNLLTKTELIKDSNVFNIIEDHDNIKLITDKEVLEFDFEVEEF